jgi:hypothetical protein
MRMSSCEKIVGIDAVELPRTNQMAPQDTSGYHSTPLSVFVDSTQCSTDNGVNAAKTWPRLRLDYVENNGEVNQDGVWFNTATLSCILLSSIITFYACQSSMSPSYLVTLVAITSFLFNLLKLS